MVQLDHYQTIDKVKPLNPSRKIYLLVCGISGENLGLVLRSADIFGVDKVIYYGKVTDDMKKIKKLSRNAATEIEFTENLNCLNELIEMQFELVALEITDSALPLKDIVFAEKTCLIVGNEQHGVPQEILDMCSKSYYIEMASKNISSLNVAIATSIALNKYLETN